MLILCVGQVPVSPALLTPTNNVEEIRRFASEIGYPIMVKAVDGGGGRGIRLIRSEAQLASSVKRAVEESPSKQVFAEKAAVDGFRHIEVQIIGDGTGNVTHLWERECSIQRRYQKVVELAPSVVSDRKLIARVIEDALRIATEVSSDANTIYLREATDPTSRSNISPSAPLNSCSTPARKNTTFSKSTPGSKSSTQSQNAYLSPTSSSRNSCSHRAHHLRHAAYPTPPLLATQLPRPQHTPSSSESPPKTYSPTGPSPSAKLPLGGFRAGMA